MADEQQPNLNLNVRVELAQAFSGRLDQLTAALLSHHIGDVHTSTLDVYFREQEAARLRLLNEG